MGHSPTKKGPTQRGVGPSIQYVHSALGLVWKWACLGGGKGYLQVCMRRTIGAVDRLPRPPGRALTCLVKRSVSTLY